MDTGVPHWVLDLLRVINKTPYGQIPITLRTDEGKVVSVTSNAFYEKHYKEGENAQATAEVITMIKNMVDTKQSGNLAFTIECKKGQVKKLITQFSAQNHYKR